MITVTRYVQDSNSASHQKTQEGQCCQLQTFTCITVLLLIFINASYFLRVKTVKFVLNIKNRCQLVNNSSNEY